MNVFCSRIQDISSRYCLPFCFIIISVLSFGQINLAPNSIYNSRPLLTGGEYLATDYSTVSKALVLEAFSTNAKIGVSSGSIYGPASGRDSVLFGGDEPNSLGQIAAPVITTEIFDRLDFPLKMECYFFNRRDVGAYNESYFALLPSNYKYFSGPTYNVNGQSTQQEGILVGGRPFKSVLVDGKGPSVPSIVLSSVTHTEASNGAWYKMEVLLKLDNNELVLEYLKVNDESVFETDISLGSLSYLDDFRLGIVVDDMAYGFKIIQESPDEVRANFTFDDEICEGECIDFTDSSEVNDPDEIEYSWEFAGADMTMSNLQSPSNVCYNEAGVYPVRLIISDGFQRDTLIKNITVNPIPRVDLGNDTVICRLEYELDATYPRARYLWSDGSIQPILSISNVGIFWVNLELGGCLFSDTIRIDTVPLQSISLRSDTVLCLGESLVLGSDISDDWTYKWNTLESTREIRVSTSGVYSVNVTDGCWDYSDTVNLSFGECDNFQIWVPNAFTPNDDAYNQVFKPTLSIGECCTVRDYEMLIYNRWGELLFVSNDVLVGWDGMYEGAVSQNGVYLCIIRYKHGLSVDHQKHVVHLLR